MACGVFAEALYPVVWAVAMISTGCFETRRASAVEHSTTAEPPSLMGPQS